MKNSENTRLITEVRKYPCLYDARNKNVKNRIKKDAWNSVSAAVIGEKWNEMDEKAKENTSEELRNRWTRLRACYVKSLKRQDGSKSKKPYLFHKELSFLLPLLQQNDNKDNLDDIQTNNIENGPFVSDDDESVFSCVSKERKLDSPDHRKVADRDDIPKSTKRPNCIRWKPDCQNANVAVQSTIQSSSSVRDPDEMFFLSQMPIIKQMKPLVKLDFQVKFMELLQSYTRNSSPGKTSAHNFDCNSSSNLTSISSCESSSDTASDDGS